MIIKREPPCSAMKHPLNVTLLLIGLFVAAQVIGLSLVSMSIEKVAVVNGATVIEHTTTAIGERPNISGYVSFLYLLGGVLIGTGLLLLLIRFRKVRLWKFWFFLAVFLSTAVAFGVLLPQLAALAIALILALLKVYRPNPWVHNITELFIYAGIAVLLVPLFDVFWALLLLIAISLYDMIAVWRTKHMVTMARFQSQSDLFAGLMVPKAPDSPSGTTPLFTQTTVIPQKDVPLPRKGTPPSQQTRLLRTTASKRSGGKTGIRQLPPPPAPSAASYAILGGGDIAFPMLFAGAVMEGLIRSGLTRVTALYESLIVVGFAAVALTLLLVFAKKERFYPAMPFLTAGCLLGWLVVLLL